MYLDNTQKFKKAFLVGGLLGSFLTYVAISKKTRQFRNELAKHLEGAFELLKEKAGEMNELGKTSFQKLAEKVVDEYAKGKELSADLRETLLKELMIRWVEIRAYFLYAKVKSRLKRAGKITREKFEEIVEEVIGDYAEENNIVNSSLKQLVRKIKSKWFILKSELDLEDE